MAADSSTYDQATIARRQKIAEAMLGDAMKPQKIEHWAQGLAQLGRAGIGGYMSHSANEDAKAEEAKQTADLYKAAGLPPPPTPEASPSIFSRIASAMSGGGQPAPEAPVAGPAGPDQASYPSPAAAAPAPPTFRPGIVAPAAPQAPIATAMSGDAGSAIAGIESGGKYDKLGPVTKTGDRAYGKYQVMGANIPQWTKTHLGQEMTPEQFLASPEAQDAVFKGQFGQYANKYGPEGAAKAWFAGERGMSNPNARDQLGTTVSAYADKFNRAYQPAGQQPYQVAGPPTAAPQAPIAQAMTPPQMPSGMFANVPKEQIPGILQGLTSKNPTLKAIAVQQLGTYNKPNEYGFQSQPDGTILRTDPRKGTVEPAYQGATKPTFGIIGEDAEGKKTYGFIDAAKGKVTPLEPAKPNETRPTVTGPDGTKIVIPEGVDVKKFRQDVTSATADAATGKKTEVQGSAEQFANRLELAEKNFKGLEKEASGAAGVAQTVAGKVPVVGTFAQTKDFQKMEQAKSQFITALLRKESGAAIGKEEFNRYDKEFFPQPGNPPEVIAQKAEARRVAIEAMKKTAGPGYKSPTEGPPKVRSTKTIGGKNYYQENGQWFEE